MAETLEAGTGWTWLGCLLTLADWLQLSSNNVTLIQALIIQLPGVWGRSKSHINQTSWAQSSSVLCCPILDCSLSYSGFRLHSITLIMAWWRWCEAVHSAHMQKNQSLHFMYSIMCLSITLYLTISYYYLLAPAIAKCLLIPVVWFLGFSLYYWGIFTLQCEAQWGICCSDLVLYKQTGSELNKNEWIVLDLGHLMTY